MQDTSWLSWRGITILPSQGVPNGYWYTVGTTLFVSPGTYELLRPLSAKETLIVLDLLKEVKEKT